jgi:hypothetical protein
VKERERIELVVLTTWLPNPRYPTENAVGGTPFPFNVTVCVPPVAAVLLIVNVADCNVAEGIVGLKVAPTLQLAPAAREPEFGHGADGAVASA